MTTIKEIRERFEDSRIVNRMIAGLMAIQVRDVTEFGSLMPNASKNVDDWWKEGFAEIADFYEKELTSLLEDIEKEFDHLFPPTFILETEYGKGELQRGIMEETHIRRCTPYELDILRKVENLLKSKRN